MPASQHRKIKCPFSYSLTIRVLVCRKKSRGSQIGGKRRGDEGPLVASSTCCFSRFAASFLRGAGAEGERFDASSFGSAADLNLPPTSRPQTSSMNLQRPEKVSGCSPKGFLMRDPAETTSPSPQQISKSVLCIGLVKAPTRQEEAVPEEAVPSPGNRAAPSPRYAS